jgi:hypothetical protein
MIQSESGSLATERRTQARIDLQIPVELTMSGRDGSMRAVTRDLSWGGALLHLSEPLPKGIDSLMLSLPWRRGKSIRVLAQPLRERPLDGGGYLVALRFISLSPRSQNRLERLLKMLYPQHSKTAGAGNASLFRELEVTVSDAEELRQTLLQILAGRYSVTVFDAYQVGQSISLSITGAVELPSIRLRARVLEVEASKAKGYDWADLHTLLLEFEHPTKTIHAFVDQVLKELFDGASDSSGLSHLQGAPDWLRSVAAAMARPTEADRAGRSGASDGLSYLESRFPEAIDRLVAGWGEVAGFEIVFNNLVLGRNGLADGWPPEAWDELELLQGVHDLAYGVSEHRRRLLKGGRL